MVIKQTFYLSCLPPSLSLDFFLFLSPSLPSLLFPSMSRSFFLSLLYGSFLPFYTPSFPHDSLFAPVLQMATPSPRAQQLLSAQWVSTETHMFGPLPWSSILIAFCPRIPRNVILTRTSHSLRAPGTVSVRKWVPSCVVMTWKGYDRSTGAMYFSILSCFVGSG